MIYFRFVLFTAIFFFYGCANVSNSSARFDNVNYNICDNEWVFWLKVPTGDSDLGMARVPAKNVEVQRRTDGKPYATVRFLGRYDPVRCRYDRAIVFVPEGSEVPDLRKSIRIEPK